MDSLKVKKILTLSDEEYFTLEQEKMWQIEWDLLDIPYEGIHISAPKNVDTEKYDVLPILAGFRLTGDRNWEIPVRQNRCYLVATNLLTGHVYFENFFYKPPTIWRPDWREKEEPRGEKPEGLAISMAIVYRADAKQIKRIPWKEEEWSFTVIYYDWVSNTVNVSLKGNLDAEPEPNFYRHFRLYKNAPIIQDPLQNDSSPKLPENGLTFNIKYERTDEKRSLIISGAYSLPSKDHYFSFTREEFDSLDKNITGLIPATLILTSKERIGELKDDFNLPVYIDQENITNGLVSGFFTFDYFEIYFDGIDIRYDSILPEMSYMAYFFIDGIIYGPQKVVVE